jgi:methanogenic corrinoid protein MtbC1
MSVTVNTRYAFSNLAVLVEEIQNSARSGRLICQRDNFQAFIYFEAGQIVHAVSGNLIGESVLYSLVNWNSGFVYFEEVSSAPDYDKSRTIDSQQAELFRQTLNLFQPTAANIEVKPSVIVVPDNGNSAGSHSESVYGINSAMSNNQRNRNNFPSEAAASTAPQDNRLNFSQSYAGSSNQVSLPVVSRAEGLEAILLPPGQVFRPPFKLQNSGPAKVIRQMVSERHTGYLGCTIRNGNQTDTAVLVMERGAITSARYSSNNQHLSGQTALDYLLSIDNAGEIVLTSVECEIKVLKAYEVVLANHVTKPNLPASTATIIQTVREVVQNRATVALRLSSPSRNLYYLLSEGEALGCYEARKGILELVDVPFSALVEEKDVRLDLLSAPASEPLNFKYGRARPATLDEIFNSETPGDIKVAARPTSKAPVARPQIGAASNDGVVSWRTIVEQGRKPYANLPATTQNFNGLRRAFEQGIYTGLIEVASSTYRLHYLIEKGVPVGLYVPDANNQKYTPASMSIFEVLDRSEFCLNVYLEQKKVSPQQFYENYLNALAEGTFSRAVKVVQEALHSGLSPETIYDEVFTPSMRQVGVLWQSGQLSVAQEHLATGITEYCRNLVMSSKSGIPTKRIGRVLLTSVSGNYHTLGINLLGDVFRWQGWEVFPLFSEMPEIEITESVFRHQIDLVCLSVSLPGQVIRAIKAVKTLRQSGWKGLIEVGGAAFLSNPEAFKQTGADFLGGDAQETVEQATRLLLERSAKA